MSRLRFERRKQNREQNVAEQDVAVRDCAQFKDIVLLYDQCVRKSTCQLDHKVAVLRRAICRPS